MGTYNRHRVKTKMLTIKLVLVALVAVAVLGDNIVYEDEILRKYMESLKDEDEILTDDEMPPFDPVEEMRKLWKGEVQEEEDFKEDLRIMGINVEDWEEKLEQTKFVEEQQGNFN